MQEIVADKELHERYIDQFIEQLIDLTRVVMASLLLMCPAPAKNYFCTVLCIGSGLSILLVVVLIVTHDVRPDLI